MEPFAIIGGIAAATMTGVGLRLGARLLNRTTRSVSLTELGAEVYPGCTRYLPPKVRVFIDHLVAGTAARSAR